MPVHILRVQLKRKRTDVNRKASHDERAHCGSVYLEVRDEEEEGIGKGRVAVFGCTRGRSEHRHMVVSQRCARTHTNQRTRTTAHKRTFSELLKQLSMHEMQRHYPVRCSSHTFMSE
jgi:hypothetical protein